MSEIEIGVSRFIGETTKYQVNKFNKGLTESIRLRTGHRVVPSFNDMIFVNNSRKMKTDTYIRTSSRLVIVPNWPEEDNRGKVNRVQRHRKSSVSCKSSMPKRQKVRV